MKNSVETDEIAVVKEVSKGYILAEISRGGACKSCSMNGMCMGSDNSVTHKIKTDGIYKKGDLIKIFISPGLKIFSSFLIFVFPIIMMIVSYLIAFSTLGLSENLSILSSFIGLFCSGIIVYIIDRFLRKKISIKIIERISK